MGRVFFAADDGTNGIVLWVSDGTPADTQNRHRSATVINRVLEVISPDAVGIQPLH
jgi:hypothetical protein